MKHTLLLFLILLSFSITTSMDFTSLVYKGCTNQHLQASQTQTLKTLLNSLASSSQQTQKPFSSSSSSSGTSPNTITGLYQCRGDLPASDCSTCVAKLQSLTPKLCKQAVAARVQLNGCYMHYEISGFGQVSGSQLLYKICNKASTPSSSGTSSFETKRDYAFEKLENGIRNNSGLFYSGRFEAVDVLGQREGDLGSSDCGDCVRSACGKAASECGDSISGQIYQHKCYISYGYYVKGVPNLTSSTGSNHHTTQKTVAVVVGGVAALGFVCVLLMFAKSLMKKRASKHGDFY